MNTRGAVVLSKEETPGLGDILGWLRCSSPLREVEEHLHVTYPADFKSRLL